MEIKTGNVDYRVGAMRREWIYFANKCFQYGVSGDPSMLRQAKANLDSIEVSLEDGGKAKRELLMRLDEEKKTYTEEVRRHEDTVEKFNYLEKLDIADKWRYQIECDHIKRLLTIFNDVCTREGSFND